MRRMERANASLTADAERRIGATGSRITQARVRILAMLLGAGRAIGHQEIERKLSASRVDRVTLYRVLDWLVSTGFAHRTVGVDRVWRFIAQHGDQAPHAHFECSTCGVLSCLQESAVPRVRLPKGYRGQSIDVTVRGLFGECAA